MVGGEVQFLTDVGNDCGVDVAWNSLKVLIVGAMKIIIGLSLPDLWPMTNPSKGVNPMDVSTQTFPRTAATLQPLPKWALTTRRSGFPKIQSRVRG